MVDDERDFYEDEKDQDSSSRQSKQGGGMLSAMERDDINAKRQPMQMPGTTTAPTSALFTAAGQCWTWEPSIVDLLT